LVYTSVNNRHTHTQREIRSQNNFTMNIIDNRHMENI
jgi:hypothetical protein